MPSAMIELISVIGSVFLIVLGWAYSAGKLNQRIEAVEKKHCPIKEVKNDLDLLQNDVNKMHENSNEISIKLSEINVKIEHLHEENTKRAIKSDDIMTKLLEMLNKTIPEKAQNV